MGFLKILIVIIAIAIGIHMKKSMDPHDEAALLVDWNDPPPWPIFIIATKISNALATLASKSTPPPIRMFELAGTFRICTMIYAATKLEIAEILGTQGPMDAAHIAAVIKGNPNRVNRLMEGLVAFDIFKRDPTNPKRYVNNELSAVLRKAHPSSAHYMVLHLIEDSYIVDRHIVKSILGKDGEPVAWDYAMKEEYSNKNGGFWRFLSDHPDQEAQFSGAMSNVDALGSKAMAIDGPFGKFKRVIDVGGSSGSFLVQILEVNPHLQGVLFDRPELINSDEIKGFYTKGGKYEAYGSRVSLQAGSFFNPEDIPKCKDRGDLLLLRHICHDWDTASVHKIIASLRVAMGNTGCSLVLGEFLVPDRVETDPLKAKYLVDILMMNFFGAQERTPSEWEEILVQHGLTTKAIHRTRSITQFVEAIVKP